MTIYLNRIGRIPKGGRKSHIMDGENTVCGMFNSAHISMHSGYWQAGESSTGKVCRVCRAGGSAQLHKQTHIKERESKAHRRAAKKAQRIELSRQAKARMTRQAEDQYQLQLVADAKKYQ